MNREEQKGWLMDQFPDKINMNSVSKINKIDTYLLIFEKQQKQTKNPTMWYIIQTELNLSYIFLIN